MAETKARKEAANRRRKKVRMSSSDIGPPDLPGPPPDQALFDECKRDLKKFCKKVFPKIFPLSWSTAHELAILRLQQSILAGGQFALAMPRGSGKTSIIIAAVLWAVLYGHRRFIAIVAAEQGMANDLLDDIKTLLERHDELLNWFPEICWPCKKLEGDGAKARYQRSGEERTNITWTADEVQLPRCEHIAAESILVARGIKSATRGLKRATKDGIIRPDFVVVDDPQTDTSAASPTECRTRESVMSKGLLMLGGPAQPFSATVLCTVIQHGDLADNILDREKHPSWKGQRTQMLSSMPERMDLWEGEYRELVLQGLAESADEFDEEHGSHLKYATPYYLENREWMDLGAESYWEDRFNPGEVSAIQHAMNLYLKDKEAFMSEMQQNPIDDMQSSSVTEKLVRSKSLYYQVGVCQETTEKVVGYVDVQKELLYYAVCAFSEGFSGHCIVYGSWPHQDGDVYYTNENARRKFSDLYEGGPDAQLTSALNDLASQLCRAWGVKDGGTVPLSRLVIDGGFSNRTIRAALSRMKIPTSVIHSHGRGITAARLPLNQNHKRKGGERIGAEWRVSWTTDPPRQKYLIYDTNFWKSFTAHRIMTEPGDRGCFTYFEGDDRFHRMFAEHMTSEGSVLTHGNGRDVEEWSLKPGRNDNHLWDCIVGCHVAASVEGIVLDEDIAEMQRRRRTVRLNRRGA